MTKLDSRDRLICAAVWRAWADHRPPPTIRELMAAAAIGSESTVQRRITGRGPAGRPRKGGGLLARGGLRDPAAGKSRQLRRYAPGPRFIGLDSDGTPLSIIS